MGSTGLTEMSSRFVRELQSWYVWGWILCRRLESGRGTVSSRVALLLRSAEVKPFVLQICLTFYGWTSLSSIHSINFRAGHHTTRPFLKPILTNLPSTSNLSIFFRAGLYMHLGDKKNHGTQDSRVVPHRGTNWAALWLTAQIERDAVLSESYGCGWHTL